MDTGAETDWSWVAMSLADWDDAYQMVKEFAAARWLVERMAKGELVERTKAHDILDAAAKMSDEDIAAFAVDVSSGKYDDVMPLMKQPPQVRLTAELESAKRFHTNEYRDRVAAEHELTAATAELERLRARVRELEQHCDDANAALAEDGWSDATWAEFQAFMEQRRCQ